MKKQSKTKSQTPRKGRAVKKPASGGYFGSPIFLLLAAGVVCGGLFWLRLVNECQTLEREIQRRESSRRVLRDTYVRENTSWNKMKSRDNVLAKLAEWNIVMGEPCYDQIVQLPLDGVPTRRRAPEAITVSHAQR